MVKYEFKIWLKIKTVMLKIGKKTANNKNAKNRKCQSFEEINKVVLEWFSHARSRGIPISGPMQMCIRDRYQVIRRLGNITFHHYLFSFC